MKNKMKLTKNKLMIRNILRVLGLGLTFLFIGQCYAVINLFIIKTLGVFDSVNIIGYFFCFIATVFTFIGIIPDDYIITYKKYLTKQENKK